MREINQEFVKQIEGEGKKRWFEDNYFDLLIWENENNEIINFQLSYNKVLDQHTVIWSKKTGYFHKKVDDGESNLGKHKASPILLSNGVFDFKFVADKFEADCKDMDKKVFEFICDKLKNYS